LVWVSLADSIGLAELGNQPSRVDLGEVPGGGELWAMMLDPKATFDEVIQRYSPDEDARRRILENRIYQQISGALAQRVADSRRRAQCR